ncbi:SusC/RagA family TonB-linked outer membrane protein [Persicobacter sp. CCB-QB2]|uniref:SusC/RagA family TonB-linked outer membrane protein n=1 Tax=Persicobacter sp. CCB-QB2 TaxID=1561025 RepID=UPI0006A96F0C|nr:SusC/RagA family TonB-linked outer membrane protein [Persicobacter sp. CCB-QB2]
MKRAILIALAVLWTGMSVYAQGRVVTGTVTAEDSGEPIPGVNVLVKGTASGTITDIEGHYSINASSSDKIIFSFIGLATEEVAVGGQSKIDMVMTADIKQLGEVVVTAMGMKRDKKSLGYAVQEVSNQELTKAGNADLATAMQGKIAGVDIKPSSGMPGASSQITIRGARSFTGNNTPLYVIDGMPVSSTPDFNTGSSVTGADVSNRAVDIDPNDIESINILKGQAAAALYGIRASNGVVVITTKSGKGNVKGKPVVTFSNFTSFDVVSRSPEYQSGYAQGYNGAFDPYSSMAWGPKLSELPNDINYGGNSQGKNGMYYVPQRASAGLDPWTTPQTYDNFNDFFRTGHTVTNSANISQATNRGHYSFGIGNSTQKGIAPGTGMERYNVKGNVETKLNDYWTTGFTANYMQNNIDKLSAGNDAILAGVFAAPATYDLKGIPSSTPEDPYDQVYYRSLTFNNPYWAVDNMTFNEQTNRFFGNGYLEFAPEIGDDMSLKVKTQIGADTYTTHLQDIYGYGHRGGTGFMQNYGVTSATVNSLTTVNFGWSINDDLSLNALVGNEINDSNQKKYSQNGYDFNFGGWSHINNTNIQQASEEQWGNRTVGFFGQLSLDYKKMLFLTATGRNDIVSQMPRGNRSFVYPSVSLGFVLTEIEAIGDIPALSFAKLRASYAEVGQAGTYRDNYLYTPSYGGGFWANAPITYPMGGVNSFIPYFVQYDPELKPQNTQSYEIGAELRFFNDRFGLDYTYSRQNVTDQIFEVPLAGSTGVSSRMMNGGAVHTDAHELVLTATPVQTKDFQWDLSVNFSRIVNVVDELADGVESIFLGGFVTPQVRAGIGYTFPVIYGTAYARDDQGRILVNDNPNAWNYGMPMPGEPDVIGNVAPDFIMGGSTRFSYKRVSLSATFEWKNGGQMYSGSNGLLDLYGVSEKTADRSTPFIYPGFKSDGTPNDIQRGGEEDAVAYQNLYANALGNIDEAYIYDNSFVKLREVTLSYRLPRFKSGLELGVNAFARNILLWSALPNFDPESSQGNNNMGGSFERFSMPQTQSFGFGFDLKF